MKPAIGKLKYFDKLLGAWIELGDVIKIKIQTKMEMPDYQCYECGWSGWEPNTKDMEESWEIKQGKWVHYPEAIHILCPACEGLFSIIIK